MDCRNVIGVKLIVFLGFSESVLCLRISLMAKLMKKGVDNDDDKDNSNDHSNNV